MGGLRLPVASRATPGDALRAVRDEPMPFALCGRWAGGGALVGASPISVVRGPAVLDAVDATARSGDDVSGVDVGGGWFGVFGFGLGEAVERLPPRPPRPAPSPDAVVGFYDHLLRLDPQGRWFFEALSDDARMRARHEELDALLRARRAPRPFALSGMTLAGAGADGHRAAVAECVERIAAGELFQANLCLRLAGRLAGSAADAWVAAAEVLEPAYGAYVGIAADAAVLSFSPELFLRRSGRAVRTAPIKGTAPRPADDPDAAARHRASLAASAKDASEHVMIVDLMRNDLGRVARFGSVVAGTAPVVEAHPGLWHLVGDVRAELRDGAGDGDLLRATFPPGSVTGAPKVQALKVIGELEGTAREAYTGAIGYVSPVAGLELNVAIRTLETRGGTAWFGCGGGVVADSDPDGELREALGKARPVVEALGATVPDPPPARRSGAPLRRLRRPDPAAGVFETIAVVDGAPVEAERHLRRLARSAGELYGVSLPPELAGVVAARAGEAGAGLSRLRIDTGPTGAAGIRLVPAAPSSAPVVLEAVTLTGGLGAHKWSDRTPLDGDVLVCDIDGTVLEASFANVWALVDGRLVTPPADGRLLPGVTRERLLERGHVGRLAMGARALHLDDVAAADALVLTSAIRLAVPAALAGHRPSEAAADLARAIREALRPRVASGLAGR